MKMTPCAWMLAAALLLSAPAHARDIEMLQPPAQSFVHQGEQELANNKKRIIAAAQSLGWQITKDEAGSMELFYDKQGKHNVRLKLSYDASSYQIQYVDSYNMNYSQSGEEMRIHPNYNRWVRNLQKRIHDFSFM